MALEDFRQSAQSVRPGEQLPLSIQAAFQEYLKRIAGKILSASPQNLFAVTTFPQGEGNPLPKYGKTMTSNVQRRYFMIDLGMDSFRMSDSVFLTPEGRVIIGINREGEYRDDLNFDRTEDGSLSFSLREVDDKIDLDYDAEGKIKNVLLLSRPGYDMGFLIEDVANLPAADELRFQGIRRTAEIDGENVLIQQYKEAKLTGSIRFPLKINSLDIVNQIFAPETLADPINARPDLDKFWKDPERIKKALGIEWTKGSPPLS